MREHGPLNTGANMSATEYRTAMNAAIQQDATRSDWTVAQWRAYFLAEAPGKEEFRLTVTKVIDLFGPTAGSTLLDAIETASKHVYFVMRNGGLDLSHKDVPAFLNGLGLDVSVRQRLTDLAARTKRRHENLKLPDPRERLMSEALSIPNGR